MPRRVQVITEGRLSVDELEQKYKNAKEGVERSHWQIIWLLAKGAKTEDVASLTGYSRSWIYELLWGYNKVGEETLGDRRKDHPGAVPLLDDEQLERLRVFVEEKKSEGKRVTGASVARWIEDELERSVNRQRGWEYLKLVTSKKVREKKVVDSSRKDSGRRLRRVGAIG